MAWRELTDDEAASLLRSERIVRVAFAANGERYVVPLGYVWHARALWGTTRPGRKVEMARADARVAFSIDDSASAASFQWRSCLGEGEFELVDASEFGESAAAAMAEAFPDNPPWNRREWSEGPSDGSSLCWRIVPQTLSGRVPYDPDVPSHVSGMS